jgi:hypothetical protein
MRGSKVRCLSVLGGALVLAAFCGSPAFAGDVVHQGVDLWMTVAGYAQTSFADEPIPAGFFCPGSQPFTGKIAFKGAPIAVEPAGSLAAIDTVVRRLDDAAFDAKGEASTRIQLMALSLASTRPIATACGDYDVAVRLDGEQPITTMRIFRTSALGGTYSAPLALNVKAVFTPVSGNRSARRELTRRIELGPGSRSVWAYVAAPQYPRGVKIDTRGDGRPDAALPPSSNFLAGVEPSVLHQRLSRPMYTSSLPSNSTTSPACPAGQTPYQSCHCTLGATDPYQSSAGCDHLHCIWTCVQATDTISTNPTTLGP